MSMMHKLFRPRPGQTLGRYVQAYVNGTAVYKGDLVCWDITAPTLQGATAGTVDGKTAGATDFLYVILPPAASAAAHGLQAGIVKGTTIYDSTANTSAQTNDDLVIIQTWGVCPDVYAVTSTDSAAGILLTTGATTGAVTQILATDTVGTDATVAQDGTLVGFGLNAQATDHVRGTVATEPGLDVWVRCDF